MLNIHERLGKAAHFLGPSIDSSNGREFNSFVSVTSVSGFLLRHHHIQLYSITYCLHVVASNLRTYLTVLNLCHVVYRQVHRKETLEM